MHPLSRPAPHPISCRRTGPTPQLILWPACQGPPPFPLLSLKSSRCSSKSLGWLAHACSNRENRARWPPFVNRERGQRAGRWLTTCSSGQNCTIGSIICTWPCALSHATSFPAESASWPNACLVLRQGVYADEKDHRANGPDLPGCSCAEQRKRRRITRRRSSRGGWRGTHSRSRSCCRESCQAGTRPAARCRDGEPRCRGQERPSRRSAR